MDTILQSVSRALGDGKLERGLAVFGETFEAARDILLNAAEMRSTAAHVLSGIDKATAAVQAELPGALASFRTAMHIWVRLPSNCV